jgi:hypothetical protein
MKNHFLLIAFVLTLASCKKDADPVAPVADQERLMPVTAYVPAAFTQKLLMELYTTVSCATCPDAQYKYRNYANNNPDRVYGVCVHTYDAMSSPQFGVLDNLFSVNQYSSASFNRIPFSNAVVIHKTQWSNNIVNTCLNKTASCGLKITSTVSGSTAQAVVTAGFNQLLSGDYRITAYLVEDSVVGTGSGYNQSNYYNAISTSPFYNMGNPIIGYPHTFVLRQVLTQPLGELVPVTSLKKGGLASNTFNFSISGYNASRLYLIAFVNKVGTTGLQHEIMNVQRVKVGESKYWD